MKKVFAAVSVVAIVGLGAYLLLRTQEPSVPVLPPAQMAGNPSGGPSTVPGANPLSPAQLSPTASPVSPVKAGSANALPDGLSAALTEAKSLWPKPDRAQVLSDCLADPRAAAEQAGLTVQANADELTAKMSSLLCRRDLSACDTMTISPDAGVGDCPNPPCQSIATFSHGKESVLPNGPGCRCWAGWLLYLDSTMRGQPDISYCRAHLAAHGLALSETDSGHLCQLLADDFQNKTDGFCREWASRPYGGVQVTLAECVPQYESFLTEGCRNAPKGIFPSCRLNTEVRSASAAKDSKLCDGNPLCLAFFSGDCEESRFEDFSDPKWRQVCDSVALSSTQLWIRKVNTRAPELLSTLAEYRRNLGTDLPAEIKSRTQDHIDAAASDLRKALAAVTSIQGTGAARPASVKPSSKGRKSPAPKTSAPS